jgi:hypothetical protein
VHRMGCQRPAAPRGHVLNQEAPAATRDPHRAECAAVRYVLRARSSGRVAPAHGARPIVDSDFDGAVVLGGAGASPPLLRTKSLTVLYLDGQSSSERADLPVHAVRYVSTALSAYDLCPSDLCQQRSCIKREGLLGELNPLMRPYTRPNSLRKYQCRRRQRILTFRAERCHIHCVCSSELRRLANQTRFSQ